MGLQEPADCFILHTSPRATEGFGRAAHRGQVKPDAVTEPVDGLEDRVFVKVLTHAVGRRAREISSCPFCVADGCVFARCVAPQAKTMGALEATDVIAELLLELAPGAADELLFGFRTGPPHNRSDALELGSEAADPSPFLAEFVMQNRRNRHIEDP
jgi:hypothetical protein